MCVGEGVFGCASGREEDAQPYKRERGNTGKQGEHFARIYSLRSQSERFHANRAFQSVGEAIRGESHRQHLTRDLTATQSHGPTMPSYYDIDAILTDAQVSEIQLSFGQLSDGGLESTMYI